MRLLLLLPLICICTGLFGQQVDSLRLSNADDALLHSPQERLDSAEHAFYSQADAVKSIHQSKLASIDSSQQEVERTIDSLQRLQLPTEKYTHKLDSVKEERLKTVRSLDAKMESLKQKATDGVAGLGLPADLQDKAADVTRSIDGFKLPVKDLNIPELNLPDSPFKSLDGLHASAPTPFGEVGKIPNANVPGVDVPGLDKLNELSAVTEKAGAYGNEIKEIANGGKLGNADQLTNAVEEKATAAAGVGNLPDADKALQEMTKTPVPLDPAAGKEQMQQQVQQVAVNHFAGKEQQLQEAMDKMAKLKKKYSSLNSLSEIPKKRPNEMRGKPLIERIVPGVALQFAGKGDDVFMDVNPYAGYRFNGRLTAGLGWNHRVVFNTENYWFERSATVYGPRAFAEFKLGGGFSPRAEFEMMNSLIPAPVLKINSEVKYWQWVPGAFIGLKKDYKFYKNIRGTGMIMFRLFNPDHKSPYVDVLNVRVGFEFPMKKKLKVKSPEQETNKSGT